MLELGSGKQMLAGDGVPNRGALIVRIRFRGILYYN